MRENNFYCFLVCHVIVSDNVVASVCTDQQSPSYAHAVKIAFRRFLFSILFGISSLVVSQRKNTDVKTSFLFKMKRIARVNRRFLVKFDNNLSYMYF